jgi:hypothetical protein
MLGWLKRLTHKNKEGFQYVEKLPGTIFVPGLNGLANDLNHGREKGLEGFLKFREFHNRPSLELPLTSSALSSESMY